MDYDFDPDDDYTDWQTPCPVCQGIGVLVVSQVNYTYTCSECDQDVTEAVLAQAKADYESAAWERTDEGRQWLAERDAERDAAMIEWYKEQAQHEQHPD
jgi:hypothetical protein